MLHCYNLIYYNVRFMNGDEFKISNRLPQSVNLNCLRNARYRSVAKQVVHLFGRRGVVGKSISANCGANDLCCVIGEKVDC